jgi:hypothetical protein
MFGSTSREAKARAGSFFRFGTLRSFGKHDDGVAAVEFAIVAAPFLAMLFAIMETAMVFFAGQTLETAVADSARVIMTGQAQTQGFDQVAFKKQVCTSDGTTARPVFAMFDCMANMTVDVQKYANFASVDVSKPVDADGKVKPGAYNPGGPCEIVVVRLIYQFPVIAAFMGLNLADMSGNKRLIVATAVFRNEPFQGTCS